MMRALALPCPLSCLPILGEKMVPAPTANNGSGASAISEHLARNSRSAPEYAWASRLDQKHVGPHAPESRKERSTDHARAEKPFSRQGRSGPDPSTVEAAFRFLVYKGAASSRENNYTRSFWRVRRPPRRAVPAFRRSNGGRFPGP